MPRMNLSILFAVVLSKLIIASPLPITSSLNARAAAVTVPNNVANGTVTAGCAAFHTVLPGESCNSIETEFGISDALFHTLNPEVNSACTNLIAGEAYCVQAASSTTPPNNVSPGTITTGCTEFFTVQSGNTCQSIESQFAISDSFFRAFNPQINALCSNLAAGEAYCVAGTPPTTVPPNVAPGTITAGCTEFHTVATGDTCNSIDTQFGLTLANFLTLNPEVNTQCTNLILGLAYCVSTA